MPDHQLQTKSPPPIGHPKHADKYIDRLIDLLKWDKATLIHSDLQKFQPTTIQNHYRISLGDYDAEINHSLHPTTNQNIYLLIFTNVAQIKAGLASEAILSYIHLPEPTYHRFKTAAQGHFERKRQEAEDQRFRDTMQPVDDIIESALSQAKKEDLNSDFHLSPLTDSQIIH